ncbi:S-adenosylmethionine:tRNA ribosyltransferase-isomerase [Flectobacillus major]|uniref:S-adenosylmethionine:tRNA ribosyltransferase-isomerase n=1 Tax=Flectobacillus major TaxID=103 RepID=UPI0003F4EB22|nr:S-adenosylmethionine:tRNA ribosyltransferase-isomerase [Flectobacillus major]
MDYTSINQIKLADFTYDLPDERIAKFPLSQRDQSKLQVYQKGKITHTQFYHIADFLPENSFLVFNNTKVIPARIHFQKATGATIQIFLLHPVAPTPVINLAMEVSTQCVWECMIGNRKRWKKGDILTQTIQVNQQAVAVSASLVDNEHENHVQLSWQAINTNDEIRFVDLIQALGEIPLPPYLNRDTQASDYETYQTIYSQKKGAVAAPTAGLHFTESVLATLAAKGIQQEFLTLHVGAGTFQPIKVENIVEHRMHNEQIVFSRKNIENLLQNIGHVIPVGTTSMRALESLYWYGVKLIQAKEDIPFFIEKLFPYQHDSMELPTLEASLLSILDNMNQKNLEEITGETEIFIFPSYQLRVCKGIITNYHQPESTLILLIAALIGEDWRKVYQEAMNNDYRFLSYGDSSLLLP